MRCRGRAVVCVRRRLRTNAASAGVAGAGSGDAGADSASCRRFPSRLVIRVLAGVRGLLRVCWGGSRCGCFSGRGRRGHRNERGGIGVACGVDRGNGGDGSPGRGCALSRREHVRDAVLEGVRRLSEGRRDVQPAHPSIPHGVDPICTRDREGSSCGCTRAAGIGRVYSRGVWEW